MWMLKTSNVTKQLALLEEKHLRSFKELRQKLKVLLANPLIAAHISQVANTNGGRYLFKNIQEAFKAPKLKFKDEGKKLEAINKSL